MALTLTIPDDLAEQLQQAAAEQQLSVEEIFVQIVRNALPRAHYFPTPEQVVAKIKTLLKNPMNPIPAQGSLLAYLRHAPHDLDFDLEEWEREWTAVEAEMKAIEQREYAKQNWATQKTERLGNLTAQINRVCDAIDTSLDPVIQRMQMLSITREEW